MRKLVGLGVLVVAGSLAFAALGGMDWLDSLGLLGKSQSLQSRVETYWQARVDDDVEVMASYEHPRQSGLASAGMLNTEEYQLDELVIEGDTATAHLTVRCRLAHPQLSHNLREITIRDRWVRYEGNWYRDLHPVGLPGTLKKLTGQWEPPSLEEADPLEEANPEAASPEEANP